LFPLIPAAAHDDAVAAAAAMLLCLQNLKHQNPSTLNSLLLNTEG
jgi:hypothetical protein